MSFSELRQMENQRLKVRETLQEDLWEFQDMVECWRRTAIYTFGTLLPPLPGESKYSVLQMGYSTSICMLIHLFQLNSPKLSCSLLMIVPIVRNLVGLPALVPDGSLQLDLLRCKLQTGQNAALASEQQQTREMDEAQSKERPDGIQRRQITAWDWMVTSLQLIV